MSYGPRNLCSTSGPYVNRCAENLFAVVVSLISFAACAVVVGRIWWKRWSCMRTGRHSSHMTEIGKLFDHLVRTGQ